jgi:glycosyltransferase involved in cell wall biosynthesis
MEVSLPKVSVCIDVYNYADFLPEAIESVLRQTFDDYEIVIVDDCSTDGSLDVALEYAARDTRIVVKRNATNLGMVGNRNACLAAARGEYVKFLHADDLLGSPDALKKLARPLDRYPAVVMTACALQFVDSRSQPAGTQGWFSGDQVRTGISVVIRSLLEQRNLVGPPSATMFRRNPAGRGFDEAYFHSADWEMWFHLLEQGCFAYVDEPLVAYRWHPRQQTEKDKHTLSQANDHRALLERYLDRSYVCFHRRTRRFLRHEALYQILRRCRRLKRLRDAVNALTAYGWLRYWSEEPRFFRWRRKANPILPWAIRYLPPEKPASRPQPARRLGINVSGFLKGEYGIGEASRAYCLRAGPQRREHPRQRSSQPGRNRIRVLRRQPLFNQSHGFFV